MGNSVGACANSRALFAGLCCSRAGSAPFSLAGTWLCDGGRKSSQREGPSSQRSVVTS